MGLHRNLFHFIWLCDFSYFCIKMFSRLRQANKDITIWSIQVQLAMFSPRESTRGDIRRLNTEQELGQWNGNGKCCICPAGGFSVEVGLGFTWMSAWLSSMHVYLYIQTLVDRHFNIRGMIELSGISDESILLRTQTDYVVPQYGSVLFVAVLNPTLSRALHTCYWHPDFPKSVARTQFFSLYPQPRCMRTWWTVLS